MDNFVYRGFRIFILKLRNEDSGRSKSLKTNVISNMSTEVTSDEHPSYHGLDVKSSDSNTYDGVDTKSPENAAL